jgi:hypothetical protein
MQKSGRREAAWLTRAISLSPPIFLTLEVLISERFLKPHSVILLAASTALWRLVFALIEKEECSKEEKTLG